MTITYPTESAETVAAVPIDFLLNTLANEAKDQNEMTKDFLLTIGFDQHELKTKADIHRAKEDILEYDDHFLPFPFDEHERELLNIFFEPAHFHLPLINEISIYQMSFHQEYPIFSPSNLSQSIIHNVEDFSPNECQTNAQDVFSIAQINHQSDHDDEEEELESITHKFDPPSHIEHDHIQSFHPFPQILFAHIDDPPTIMEHEDEQSTSSILPDVIPSIIQNEVTPSNGMPLCMSAYSIDQIKLCLVNQCRMTRSIIILSKLRTSYLFLLHVNVLLAFVSLLINRSIRYCLDLINLCLHACTSFIYI